MISSTFHKPEETNGTEFGWKSYIATYDIQKMPRPGFAIIVRITEQGKWLARITVNWYGPGRIASWSLSRRCRARFIRCQADYRWNSTFRHRGAARREHGRRQTECSRNGSHGRLSKRSTDDECGQCSPSSKALMENLAIIVFMKAGKS